MAVSVIRTVILYFLLIGAMRLMGKRQLSELQPTELAVTLLVSDLAAVPMQENGLPLVNGILPILVLVALELLLSGLMLKSPALSHLISGCPIAVIKDGRLDAKALSRLRLTVEDLTEALRKQNIFSIEQVQYAIAETNGHISAYCRPAYQPATAQDVGQQPPDDGMPTVLVSDGRVSAWGLSLCGFDRAWLDGLLQQHGVELKQVFLLTASKSGRHFLLTCDQVDGGAL